MTSPYYNFFLKSGYINAPLTNGIGRFVQQCQRMTIKFCKSHADSQGVREFIENDLIDFARANPGVVLYLKPRRHRSPVLVAEYLNGHRDWMSMHEFSREEVGKWVNLFRSASGTGDMRYKNFHKTHNPTIQGPWNQFTNKAPEKNLAKFPHEGLSHPVNLPPTATEILLELNNSKTAI